MKPIDGSRLVETTGMYCVYVYVYVCARARTRYDSESIKSFLVALTFLSVSLRIFTCKQ